MGAFSKFNSFDIVYHCTAGNTGKKETNIAIRYYSGDNNILSNS